MCGSLSFSKFLDPGGLWKKDTPAPAAAPVTSANQQRQAAETDAQVAANESIAARRKKSTSLLATGSPTGISGDATTASVLATGKTQLGQ